jgi:lipopolysaccharide transport protein LptA
MKRHTEAAGRLALGLTLLACAWSAAGDDAPVTADVAATAVAAAPGAKAATPASSKVDQTKDQLTKLPSANDFRPTGPVTIGANKAELVQGNAATYLGNVTLDSDTLKMDGDRLDLKRFPDGQYTAKITGGPAHMSHAGNGPDNPPVTAHAKTMTYDSRSGIIDLVGDALLTRGNDKTTAETIRYHVQEQRYEASGGSDGNGRVTIVIPQVNAPGNAAPQPPPAPAPANEPAAGDGNAPAAKPPPTTPPAATPPQDGSTPPKP